ncbi:hypothetical protein DSECCO2_493910 [anaerobic digester metagenome]
MLTHALGAGKEVVLRKLPVREGPLLGRYALGAGKKVVLGDPLIFVLERLLPAGLLEFLRPAERIVLRKPSLLVLERPLPAGLLEVFRSAERVMLRNTSPVPERSLLGRYALGACEEVDLGQPLPGLFPGHPVDHREVRALEEVDQRLDRRRPDHHERVRRCLPDSL